MSKNKQLCLLSSRAPYASMTAKEALDAALIGAAFDLDITLIFNGEGVFSLLKEQNPKALGQKNFSAALPALEMYGIEKIWVDQKALDERGLTLEQLCIAAEPVSREQIGLCINESSMVLNF